MACNNFCTAHMADLAAEQNTKCTMMCDGITDLKSGFQAVSTFLLTALRAKYQKIIEEHPDEAANLMAAVMKLQDGERFRERHTRARARVCVCVCVCV
jgi:hypothetical protein